MSLCWCWEIFIWLIIRKHDKFYSFVVESLRNFGWWRWLSLTLYATSNFALLLVLRLKICFITHPENWCGFCSLWSFGTSWSTRQRPYQLMMDSLPRDQYLVWLDLWLQLVLVRRRRLEIFLELMYYLKNDCQELCTSV